jgi:hypothetical protein
VPVGFVNTGIDYTAVEADETDTESLSTASEPTVEEINESKQYIDNLIAWLGSADVDITCSVKQRNIATALYKDGWAR